MTQQEIEERIQGQVVCPGVALGTPYSIVREEGIVREFSIAPDQVQEEILRYRDAVLQSTAQVERIKKQLESEDALEGVAILDAHLAMMQDSLFTTKVEKEIADKNCNAEAALNHLIQSYQIRFEQVSDNFFRERLQDIRDIARRITGHLRQSQPFSMADVPKDSIILADQLVPSDTAEARGDHVSAFVTQSGGSTSHAAIVAKSKGIPFVSCVDIARIQEHGGKEIIVDGRSGEIILNPSLKTRRAYQRLRRKAERHYEKLESTAGFNAETYDGYAVRLSSNLEMTNELDILHEYGGNGVGLFRTEYMCLARQGFPSEEEQFTIYRSLVEKMRGLPVVIRSFDLGGDKATEASAEKTGDDALLGCRAIRFLLKEREIFKTQLKAILRASHFGDVSLLLPLISCVPELREAKAILSEARKELRARGEPCADHIRVGCMIEVPSAAIICDLLARECDFLSIGTNDLVQYSLAVDRGNQSVGSLYGPTHPSVIRMIKMVVSEANRHGIPVSVCGEVAADPRFTAALLGLGVREFSVSARFLPIIKQAIRNTSILDAVRFAERVLGMATAHEVQEALVAEYQKLAPDDPLIEF